MKIHCEELTDVSRYLTNRSTVRLEEMENRYQSLMRCLNQVKPITPKMRMLEVGTGLGLFPIWCTLRGLDCKGLEISPALIAHAQALAREYHVDVDIILGNLEDYQMEPGQFDVIVAACLFEHVQDWKRGLQQIHRWLRPGGLLLFESTNKFAPRSDEFAKMPFYGWLPNGARYRLRQAVHGRDIMQLGIDFHQFTQRSLRRTFRDVGFARVFDRVDLSDPLASQGLKRQILDSAKRSRLLRSAFLTFVDLSLFVCVK